MSNKRLAIYAGVTLFCALFSTVYELFSHGVYSPYMVYLFAIPLVLGVIPEALGLLWPRLIGGAWQRTIHGFAVATLTVGSALMGVLEIYGTTSAFTIYYLVAGIGLLLLAPAMRFLKAN